MKHLIAAAVLLLLVRSAPADEIKALLGVHSSKYLFSSEIVSLSRRQKTGLDLGLGYAFTIGPKIMLEADVLYSEKGAKAGLIYAPGSEVPGIYRNTSIGIPLLFKYKLAPGASPYVALGPEFVFILSHHLELPELETNFDISDNTKKFVMAFTVLLGYELPLDPWRLLAEIRYNRWLGNFLNDPGATAKSETVALVLGAAYTL
jgi:hypothetical protein